MTWFTRAAGTLVALALTAVSASAQDYPTRPITLIVPFAAGGPTDVISRIVGEHMSRTLGQQLVIALLPMIRQQRDVVFVEGEQ